ncbi:hypothetical protein DPMN_160925 [Dreissena polymorpha]|uniref:Uncharacterized protein n=1 Tax=Dreissena polymorpha TaxID=45954 RepID=A0A9D4EP21_DREPO|nr:hypothetical protein DPMN_160925 [Dreissena polymorpha]
MNLTLQDALLNLTTMVKSWGDLKIEDRDFSSLQHTLNVADTLHHLTGDVINRRLEHAFSGEKNKLASSYQTIGVVAAIVAGIAGAASITAAAISVGGSGPSTIGAGKAGLQF